METRPAAASYRRDLGDGLILRWSTMDDAERLAHLFGTVWRNSADEPINPRMQEVMRRHVRGGYPLVGPGDCALVEATEAAGRPIVACTFLWREQWSFEGIPFEIGRPENVATDPAYRNRGLVRAMIELVHARSAAESHPLQAITGIPNFYRQFGYEYAFDLHGRRVAYTALLPPAPPDTPEPYALRPATVADVPRITELYQRRRAESVVWNEVGEQYWRYLVEVWGDPSAPHDPLAMGVGECLQIIVDATGEVCGYAMVAAKLWGSDLQIMSVELAPHVSLVSAAPPLLRALHAYGDRLPSLATNPAPLRELSFYLGRTHPLNAVLAPSLAPITELPYAWYVRVPDLLAFLQLITPALERRLANSPAAGYSGELTISLYRSGLHLRFDAGQLAEVAPWQAPPYSANPDAGFPALVFLQLLFGYRSLADLRYAFPDVSANHKAELLLNAVFPARPSWVMAL
jgi:GNAT superfamily N-acetyltransferase